MEQKFHVYGTKNEPPMKEKFRDAPLPEALNREAEDIARKFNYPALLEIVKAAKALKRYGTAHFYLNGIEVAKFEFWFGICMRIIFAQGDIGDKYQEIVEKLTKAHGKIVPIALFMRSLVPDSISTLRPMREGYVDRKSPEFKEKYLKGEF
jgi:hypothetical protein